MFWIMLTTAALLVFGGLLAVLPSKRERQIGQMRIEARKQGIHIGSDTLPNVNAPLVERVTSGGKIRKPTIQCVVWGKHYSDDSATFPSWRLLKSDKGNTPIEGFEANPPLDNTQSSLNGSYWISVQEVLDSIPKEIAALQCTPQSVAWIGVERLDSSPDEFICQMSTALDRLMDLNVAIGMKDNS